VVIDLNWTTALLHSDSPDSPFDDLTAALPG
jgi:hypothetical protein